MISRTSTLPDVPSDAESRTIAEHVWAHCDSETEPDVESIDDDGPAVADHLVEPPCRAVRGQAVYMQPKPKVKLDRQSRASSKVFWDQQTRAAVSKK